jgi:Arc/MetJ-type ribon-helix-helix transcriptional regulator
MADRNREFPKRLTVQVTDAMDDRLEQVARGRDEPKAEVVRAALRAFLDEQEDVIGSRKHFTKAFGRRVDYIERLLSVTLWLNLQTLHLLYERLHKEQLEAGELLADAIREGVDLNDTVSELIESVTAQKKTKPPA